MSVDDDTIQFAYILVPIETLPYWYKTGGRAFNKSWNIAIITQQLSRARKIF